jgi:hypothetical protein
MVGVTYKRHGKQGATMAEEQNNTKAGAQTEMGGNNLLAAGAK